MGYGYGQEFGQGLAAPEQALEKTYTAGWQDAKSGQGSRRASAVEAAVAERPAWTAQSVMEWVLDEASLTDIENLFQRLGTRFAELKKEAS